MESSFLIEVDNTSTIRTGALHCYHYTLTPLPASRLLLPRSGLERSDFVLWRISEVAKPLIEVHLEVRLWWHSGLDLLTLSSSHFDPLRTSRPFSITSFS